MSEADDIVKQLRNLAEHDSPQGIALLKLDAAIRARKP